jgi:hypothetical protein
VKHGGDTIGEVWQVREAGSTEVRFHAFAISKADGSKRRVGGNFLSKGAAAKALSGRKAA